MATNKEPMTTAAYLKKGGGCCPFCQSDNIEGDGVDIEYGSAGQEVVCTDCGAVWVDHYKLAGFLVLEKPEG